MDKTNTTATRLYGHADDCTNIITPARTGTDVIILVQKCPCGYVAPVWDGTKGVRK